jgi:chromosome segregation ATPase
VNGKPRHVPKKVKFSAPGASSEGAVAQLEHERIVELERQLELAKANANVNATKAAKRVELELRKQADQILVQTSRVNQKDAELVSLQAKLDELLISRTQDARAVDQAQSALQKAKADADERSQRACKQIDQYETELAEVRAELQARKSELEKSTSCAAETDERSQRTYKQIDQYETELAEVRAELQARKSELVKATSCAAEADEWSLRAYKQIGQYATELAEVRVEFQARKSELEKATFRAAEADERSQRASEQIEQYVKELAEVRTELDTKKSELEAVRLRLRDTENGWTKSKVQPETLNAPTAKSPNNMEDNMEEGQITCRLMERMQAMEAEIASLRWSEKSFERMECRNEG